jgi:predicted Zn-dependent protease
MSLNQGRRPIEVSAFLEQLDTTKESAVLTEKLADLYVMQGKPSSAIETYQRALKLNPSPIQRVRIRLELADKLVATERSREAYDDLKALLDEDPNYPGKPTVLKRLLDLANKLGDKDAVAALLHESH